MAGKGVRVLATPTSDLGKILACMHGMVFFFFFFFIIHLLVYVSDSILILGFWKFCFWIGK